MAKLFAIVSMTGGNPDIDASVTPYTGYVFCDQLGVFGAYLISGTNQQLIDINALTSVIGIVAVTESGGVKWAELDGIIAPAVRTKLNNFLTVKGITNIPAGRTYRQVINAVFQRFNARFDLSGMDIME